MVICWRSLDHGLLHCVCLIDRIKRVCVGSINQSLQSPDKQAKTRTHTNTLPINSSHMSKTPKTWRLNGLELFPASIKGLWEHLLVIHAVAKQYFHLKQHEMFCLCQRNYLPIFFFAYLHLRIWQMILSRATYIAFKVHIYPFFFLFLFSLQI